MPEATNRDFSGGAPEAPAALEAWRLRLNAPRAAAAKAEEALAGELPPVGRVVALAALATSRLALDEPAAALEAAGAVRALCAQAAGTGPGRVGEAETEACLAGLRAAFLLGDAAAALDWGGEALALAQRHGLPRLAARAHNDLAAVYGSRGLLDVAVKYLDAGIALLEAAGEAVAPPLLNNLGNVYLDLGRHDEALGCFARSRKSFLLEGDRFGAAIARSNEGRCLARLARHDEATAALREALAWFTTLDNERYRAATLAKLAEVRSGAGDAEGAEALFSEALAGAAEGRDSFEPDIRASHGEFLIGAARFAEALAELESAAAAYRVAGNAVAATGTMRSAAAALAGLGRHAEAYGRLEAYVAERARDEAERSSQALALLVTQLELGLGETHEVNVVARRAVVEANRRLREQATRLEALSSTDDLTGLRNRRYLRERLEEAVAREDSDDVAVVLLDVDHFKAVNDAYSHVVGDEVLAQVAALLRGAFRSTDVLARWGGEEFMVLAPGSGKAAAAAAADRARRLVAGHDWAACAPGLRVTLSAGVAALSELGSGGPGDAGDAAVAARVSELVKLVDRRLYAAKRAGRDRTHG